MVVCVGLIGFSTYALGAVFNDGGPHVIDQPLDETVQVRDAESGVATTIRIEQDGSLTMLTELFGQSQAEIAGGSMVSLRGYDQSRARLISGEMLTYTELHDSASFIMDGGELFLLHMLNDSYAEIHGGVVITDFTLFQRASMLVTGTNTGRINLYNDSTATLLGGTIRQGIVGHDQALFELVAARVILNGAEADSGSLLTGSGRLHVTWLDRTTTAFDFELNDMAAIHFVPEPASALLWGVGLLAAIRRTRPAA